MNKSIAILLVLDGFYSKMFSLKVFILSVFWFEAIFARKLCDVNDPDCTRRGVAAIFPLFINGIEDVVETSDPLVLKTVTGNLPTIKYNFQNAKLSGLKSCKVTTMTVNKEQSNFQFHLECPHIQMAADYDLLGHIADMFVEGEGKFTVTCDDYVLMFTGYFNKTTEKDNKKHVHIKKYLLDVNPRGKVEFDFKNLFNGDKERSDEVHKYLNKNWKTMDKELRAPTLTLFTDKLIDNLNQFLKIIPIEEIFPHQI